MSYPDRPTCHDGPETPKYGDIPIAWEVRPATGPSGVNLRHCSYCGSLHPEDLLKVLEQGATLEGADWKYCWPHKFYVNGIPNPKAGEIVEMGSRSYINNQGKRVNEPLMHPAPDTLTAKFYNKHFLDLAGTPEFDLVVEAIQIRTGVGFEIREEGRLFWYLVRSSAGEQ